MSLGKSQNTQKQIKAQWFVLLKNHGVTSRSLHIQLDDAMSHIRNCPYDVYMNISSSIYLVSEIVKEACTEHKEVDYSKVPMMEEVVTLASVASNPFATKKDVCP